MAVKSSPETQMRVHAITKQDLPLCCPMPGKAIWSQHPRVFLPIDRENGKAKCPYCSTEYVLKD